MVIISEGFGSHWRLGGTRVIVVVFCGVVGCGIDWGNVTCLKGLVRVRSGGRCCKRFGSFDLLQFPPLNVFEGAHSLACCVPVGRRGPGGECNPSLRNSRGRCLELGVERMGSEEM